MRIALVLGGDPPSAADMKLLDACDEIVACDAGAHALLEAQRTPTLIVGDLDSLDADTYKWAEALEVPFERHPEAKDQTDGELAIDKVLSMNPTSVLILGGHGGRTAMFMANLRILRHAHSQGLEALMVGRGESIRFVGAGDELNLAGRAGSTLNLLAMHGDATVSLSGTSWDGEEIPLLATTARGVSNKIVEDGCQIRVHEGTVLIVTEQPEE